ncbi:15738_t:CDS:2 [Entrophospora sp. SA101]|nr:15738_t:CDS:2 [Entrophospora sp. SA101]
MILSIGGTTSTTLQQPFPELSQRNKRRILSSGSKFRNSQRPISMDPQSSLSSSDKIPEFSPPESSQTKYHRLSVKFLINPKTSHELRKELHKINEEYKNEQDSWKAEKRKLKMTKGTKQEDLDRTKRKLKESTEKYNKKIEKLNNLFQQQISIGNNSNNGHGNDSRGDIGREIIIMSGNDSYNNYI